MPNIIFYINRGTKSYINKGSKNEEVRIPLMAKIDYNKKRHTKQIIKIREKDWDNNKKRIRTPEKKAKQNNHTEINAKLNKLEANAKKYFDYCALNNQRISTDKIYDVLNGIDPIKGKKLIDQDLTFSQAFEEWIDYSKRTKAHNTYRSRRTTYRFLLAFETNESYPITFQNIDLKLFDRLKIYSSDIKKHSNDTFAKNIKILRMFLNWCYEREYFTGRIPRNFQATQRGAKPITLTVNEFKTLYSFKFENKKHQRCSDIFCFGCLTGLRYSDLHKLRREHINNGFIEVTTTKTNDNLKIPILPMAQKIIDKYNEQPIYILPQISNQKYNAYLKELFKIAEIDRQIIKENYIDSKKITVIKPLHEIITAHISRKSFITICFHLKMDIKYIMKISGHKTERSLLPYLKIAEERTKEELEKAWEKL